MVQSFPGFHPIHGPSWSLSCEAGAYLCFPLIAWWALRRSGRSALAWAFLLLTVGGIAINLVVQLPNELWMMTYPVMWIRAGTEFTAGVLIWVWWKERARRSARWDVVVVASLLATVAFSYLTPPPTYGYAPNPLSTLAVPLVGLCMVACTAATGPVCRFLSSRAMQWLGNLTFGIYMGHFAMLEIFRSVLPWEAFEDTALPVRIGYVVMLLVWTVGIGAFLHYCVEEPARKVLLRWWSPRRAPAASAA
jgi:peptidoglycan/LPS O-acetylase OafA/YrhL